MTFTPTNKATTYRYVRQGLTAFLATAQDLEVMAVVTCGAEAVAPTKKHASDVVLLDLLMPGQPAVRTVRQM